MCTIEENHVSATEINQLNIWNGFSAEFGQRLVAEKVKESSSRVSPSFFSSCGYSCKVCVRAVGEKKEKVKGSIVQVPCANRA